MAAPTVPIIIGGIFAWSIYRRVRRNIGRQPLRPKRTIVSIVLLSLVALWLWFVSLVFPKLLVGFGSGIVLGSILGFVGLRLTKFETTEEGHFYTPNIYIGMALSLLLVGRMIYRMWVVQDQTQAMASGQPPQIMQSPLTFVIVGLTIGYYLVYRIGVFVHTHDKPVPNLKQEGQGG